MGPVGWDPSIRAMGGVVAGREGGDPAASSRGGSVSSRAHRASSSCGVNGICEPIASEGSPCEKAGEDLPGKPSSENLFPQRLQRGTPPARLITGRTSLWQWLHHILDSLPEGCSTIGKIRSKFPREAISWGADYHDRPISRKTDSHSPRIGPGCTTQCPKIHSRRVWDFSTSQGSAASQVSVAWNTGYHDKSNCRIRNRTGGFAIPRNQRPATPKGLDSNLGDDSGSDSCTHNPGTDKCTGRPSCRFQQSLQTISPVLNSENEIPINPKLGASFGRRKRFRT